ncbi:MAG: hypothetical protein HOP30_11190 [Cyclobacteriaceae bacterium]|nr:hypothetical protein [Cyclobacteriaceae bacterium]
MIDLQKQIEFVRGARHLVYHRKKSEVVLKKENHAMLMAIEQTLMSTAVNEQKGIRARLIEMICKEYECTHEQLFGKERTTNLVNARKCYAAIARFNLNDNVAKIGEALNGRDHSVVMNLLRRVADDEFTTAYNAKVIAKITKQLLTNNSL